MKIRSIVGTASLGLILAVAPMGGSAIGLIQTAFAKRGNGGDGGGHGNGGGHGEGKADHEKAGSEDTDSTSANIHGPGLFMVGKITSLGQAFQDA